MAERSNAVLEHPLAFEIEVPEGLLRERLATWSATGKFISHVFGPSAPLQ